VTERTIERLEEASVSGAPFFLQCSYPDPHHPFTPPGRFYEMFDPAEIPLPPTWDDPHTDSMPQFRRMGSRRGEQPWMVSPFAPTEEQFRQSAAKEYGMIAMIDEGVGRIVAALERLGLADDTVVVFTSDHGDMFGDHGLMLKGGMHYRGCLRVPLVIAAPGSAPGVCRSLVGSLDVAPTLLELVSLPAFHGMQGESLAPLLEDPARRTREFVLTEEDEMVGMNPLGEPIRMRTLTTGSARLTLHRGSTHGELFDLERDPDERRNLFGKREAAALQAELTGSMAHRMMEYADAAPKPRYNA
jgi:arylsulfatase A-like enzyme